MKPKPSKRLVSGSTYKGYRLRNHGYYAPDRKLWWEAQNIKTGEADFHAHTLRGLKADIDASINRRTNPISWTTNL